jgi:hypothetical protein
MESSDPKLRRFFFNTTVTLPIAALENYLFKCLFSVGHYPQPPNIDAKVARTGLVSMLP